jgi:hypothetical protein
MINKTTSGCGTAKMDEPDKSKTNDGGATEVPTVSGDGLFNVKIYPNPFTDRFYISVENAGNEPVQINIFTITGALVATKTQEFTGLDLETGANLADGVYLVEIKQKDKTKVLRMIKSQ